MIMDVSFNGENAGEVSLKKAGLYWVISCRLKVRTAGYYRLAVKSEKGITNLGTCVYYDGQLGMDKRISVSALGEKPELFWLDGETNIHKRKIKYISENEAFPDVSELPMSKFTIHDGKPAVVWDSQ